MQATGRRVTAQIRLFWFEAPADLSDDPRGENVRAAPGPTLMPAARAQALPPRQRPRPPGHIEGVAKLYASAASSTSPESPPCI